jgi:hypothetical protein
MFRTTVVNFAESRVATGAVTALRYEMRIVLICA